jgi:cytochrome c biogenesis protein CcmG/thiol:disulfide interchange protein DsbE
LKRIALWAPLAIFALLFAVVASGLIRPASTTIKSAMVGKPLPRFALPPIVAGKAGVASVTFGQGQPRLLNVFASWCVPCIAEAPQLMRLKALGVPIDGLAVRDTGPAVAAFLKRNGDPYARIGSDAQSAVQLSLGSSGVPETFVVDGRGVVVKQVIGDIHAENVPEILQALKEAR